MRTLRSVRAIRLSIPSLLLPLLVLAAALAVGVPPVAAAPTPMPGVEMVEAWPGVEFAQPIDVAAPGDGSNLVFVAELEGTIQAIPKYRGAGPVPRPTRFLDIRSKVHARAQGGLLGLAFHPDYKANKRFYVSYLAKRPNPRPGEPGFKLVISEFRGNGTRADARSERVLMEIPKANAAHHAGGLRFGPDGMLYISVGDAHQQDAAQLPRSYFGKILRIDPMNRTGNLPYAIPRGNPWPSVPGVKPEVWAYGFRNPWRFGWDLQGRMFAVEPGTSGPESREWLIEVKYGGNHGWPYMEGTRQLKRPSKPQDFVRPTYEYVRGDRDSTAGIGGTAYRGDRIKSLRGKYVFGDFMLGEVYCIDLVTQGSGKNARVVGRNVRKLGDVPEFSGVGEDAQGEMYFCSKDVGIIFTLAPRG